MMSIRRLVIAVFICAACAEKPESVPQDSSGSQVFPVDKDVLISSSGIGYVELGKTLAEASRRSPDLVFERTSDGEGVALVAVGLGSDTLIAYTGEDDVSSQPDLERKVQSLEAITPGFMTAHGIHPGSLVSDAESVYGKITRIDRSEIESREYVTFANQPSNLTFRLDAGSGVFGDSSVTTNLKPRSRIFSISVQP
jgi:hypothetical protein